MKTVFYLLLFILICSSSRAKEFIDVVHLKDSTKIVGNIIEQVPNVSITIRDFQEQIHVIKMEDVQLIKHYDKADINLNQMKYYEIGGSLGTPAVLNINAVGWYKFLGIGLSGMYLGNDNYGIQANIKIKFSDNFYRYHSISFLFYRTYSSSPVTKPEAPYFRDEYISDAQVYCITYNLNYKGFWLEIGPGMNFWFTQTKNGRADNWFPSFAFQIGYVHRFIY